MNQRCDFLAAAALLAGLTVRPRADDFPAKPVTMIIPFPAGGRTDVIGRIFAQSLQEALGKPVAVINKPGASSVLGSNEVSEADSRRLHRGLLLDSGRDGAIYRSHAAVAQKL